ncbi:MAG TPA: hypothetical protein VEU33_01215 [Archangium sp.]|nr:hypothetical protein [Archangium sp.]
MRVMSVYVRLTESSGAASMSAPSIVTLQNPAGSAFKSNVWARTADQTAVKVAACARFYPSNASNQAQASASGCTAAHLLP